MDPIEFVKMVSCRWLLVSCHLYLLRVAYSGSRGDKQTNLKSLPAIASRSGEAGGRNPKSEINQN
jgi:hypothetical protein